MYDEKKATGNDGDLKVEREGEAERQASSIEIEIVSGNSEFAGLKERKARLERAAKMLGEGTEGKT